MNIGNSGRCAPVFTASAIVYLVLFWALIFTTEVGRIGLRPFTWHPALMIAGVTCMGAGVTIYSADCGSRLNAVLGSDKASRRKLHGALGTASVALVLLAWFTAWYVHRHVGQPKEESEQRTLHDIKSMAVYLQVSTEWHYTNFFNCSCAFRYIS
jgi:hypothetical protein